MPDPHDHDEELERKLKEAFGDPDKGEEEPEPDPFDSRLKEIEDRAKKIRVNNPGQEPPEWKLQPLDTPQKNQRADGQYYRDVGFGLAVLYSLVGPFIAGFAVGWLIDRTHPGSSAGEMWGTVAGAICGLIGVFITISKHNSK